MRSRRSRGASSTEYALLIALLGGMLCLGIGSFAKDLFGNSLCTIGQFVDAGNCPQAGPEPGSPSDEPGPHATGPSTGPLPSASCADGPDAPDPTATATPTPTPASTSSQACSTS